MQKRVGFFWKNFFAIFLTLSLLEIVSFLAFEKLAGKPFSLKALKRSRLERMDYLKNDALKQFAKGRVDGMYSFHPYLGYIGYPGTSHLLPGISVNEFGFQSNHSFARKKKENDFVVGVFGGSVASIFALIAENDLKKELGAIDPGFTNKNLIIHNFANAGYKQPQQIFSLIYSSLIKVDFDFILNIDGFNEVVIATENPDLGVHPIFPSVYHFGLMSKKLVGWDAGTIDFLNFVKDTYETELTLLTLIQKNPYSIFLNLFGELWIQRNIQRINKKSYDHSTTMKVADDFRGPKIKSNQESLQMALKYWMSSSILMNSMAENKKIPYAHVLQPNQYVPGSKTLTKHEKEIAYKPDRKWSRLAQNGYPLLIEKGREFKRKNFPFYDLTEIFKDVHEDIYTDGCCHFAERGNQILAKGIARVIVSELKRLKKKAGK